jgi:hypothetical protein
LAVDALCVRNQHVSGPVQTSQDSPLWCIVRVASPKADEAIRCVTVIFPVSAVSSRAAALIGRTHPIRELRTTTSSSLIGFFSAITDLSHKHRRKSMSLYQRDGITYTIRILTSGLSTIVLYKAISIRLFILPHQLGLHKSDIRGRSLLTVVFPQKPGYGNQHAHI